MINESAITEPELSKLPQNILPLTAIVPLGQLSKDRLTKEFDVVFPIFV